MGGDRGWDLCFADGSAWPLYRAGLPARCGVGAVLTVMGLSLLPVAVQYAAGGYVPDAGKPAYIGLAFSVLAAIILLNVFGRVFIKNISVFLSLLVGIALAGAMGMLDFSAVPEAAPVAIVTPFAFGMPTFHLVPILTMCLVVAIPGWSRLGIQLLSERWWVSLPLKLLFRTCFGQTVCRW